MFISMNMADCTKILFICISLFVIVTQVTSSGDCPKFVCPTVHDDIADDEIQLEAVQIPRPPIVDLQKYGINEDITHWSCERPLEEVRLEWNENSNGEGRVEIFYSNQWGTVCNTTWDMTAANVVCRQLGFWRAYASVDGGVFGSTTGPVWLDRTECSGDEDSLYRCRKDRVGQNQCQHETDAAVICDLTGQLIVSTTGGDNGTLLYSNTSDSSGFYEGAPANIPAITMHYHKEENTLYWIQDVEGSSLCELRRMVMNGSNQWETFASVTVCNEYSSVTVDDVSGFVFWVEPPPSGRVMKKAIIGSNQAVTLHTYETLTRYATTIAIRKATRQLYVIKKGWITRSDMDFSNWVDVLVFPQSTTTGKCLTLDEPGGMMYFVDDPGVIKIAPIDRGQEQVVFLDIGETPSSMLFASGWLVWVEPINRRVGRMALRGSSQEIIYQEINDEVESPSGVAFIP